MVYKYEPHEEQQHGLSIQLKQKQHFEYLENIPETTQLVALVDSVIIGTVSFTFDNSLGLPSDVDYHEETDKLRL